MDEHITQRPTIALKECTSSYLRAYGYDAATQTLRVRFNGGKVFDYAKVEPAQYEALAQAPSKGRFFLDDIRDVYTCTEVDETPEVPENDSKGG